MNNYSKLLAIAAVALFVAAAPLAVTAQSSTAFGSQVKLGDVDFRPTESRAAGSVAFAVGNVMEIDFGVTTQVTDNCFYLKHTQFDGVAHASATNVENFDVRLTPCQGKAAGTLVGDADTVEKATAFTVVTGPAFISYADVNNNGRYDSGDYVYLTSGAAPAATATTLIASNGLQQFTVRLTAAGSFAAGTLVFASDADFTSYNAAVKTLGTVGHGVLFDADNTGTLTTGDSVYLSPAVVATGALFPQFAIRLVGGAGAFGTQIKLGDLDFVPTQSLAAGITAATLKQIDFGVTGQVTDNCFYLETGSLVATAVVNFDTRLTPCQGKAAGTLVLDADTVEKATVSTALTVTAKFADVNNNGRYDAGDYVYLGTGAATVLQASNALTSVTIRLTPAGSMAAGTLVFASDSDFTSYNAAVKAYPGAVATALGVFDADNTGTVTTGDSVYLWSGAVAPAAGAVFPQYSVRLVGGSGAFGTQAKLGDADFVPTLISTAATTLLLGANEIDFGVTAQVTDNCFYYQQAAAANVANFNVRLNPCQGNAAGSMIADASTVEKATVTVGAPAGAVAITYADVNNNGRYDTGDCVYMTTGAANALTASTGNALWTLRLTACGSMAAGTLVFASDSDFTSYKAASPALGTGVVAYFDADNTATVTSGDVLYVLPGALPANALVPLYSVRLSGTPTASGPAGSGGGGGTTGTGTSTSTSTSTATSTVTNTATNTATATSTVSGTQTVNPGQSSTSSPTPGFELVALVGALAVALVLVRRKL